MVGKLGVSFYLFFVEISKLTERFYELSTFKVCVTRDYDFPTYYVKLVEELDVE